MENSATKNMVLTRIFDAPVERVWKAWSDGEQVMRWWGPNGFTCPVADMDFRGGGVSLVCMRAPAEYGGMDMYNTWTYTKIIPMHVIEFVHHFSDKDGNQLNPAGMNLPPGIPFEVPHVLTFKAIGDNQTEFTVTEYGYPSDEVVEISRSGMMECLDKLAASLKSTAEGGSTMTATPDMKLELVPLPVSDINRARDFYVNKLGFHLDHDTQPSETMRVIQLTPPGSACSIFIGTGLGEMSDMIPGSVKGLHLVVKDIRQMRDLFVSRGIEMGEIIEYPRGIKFVYFNDPDGNAWALQEIPPGI